MSDEFNNWNELKKYIEIRSFVPDRFPTKGEVWMISLGKNVGYEQAGTGTHFGRPMLVVKKFNNLLFWCVPLSTKQKDFDFYYNYTDIDGRKVSGIISQMKPISIKRFDRYMHTISSKDLLGIINKIKYFLN